MAPKPTAKCSTATEPSGHPSRASTRHGGEPLGSPKPGIGEGGGHGHNYFEETFWYWDSVLGSQTRTQLTPELAERMRDFVERDQLNKPSDFRTHVRKQL